MCNAARFFVLFLYLCGSFVHADQASPSDTQNIIPYQKIDREEDRAKTHDPTNSQKKVWARIPKFEGSGAEIVRAGVVNPKLAENIGLNSAQLSNFLTLAVRAVDVADAWVGIRDNSYIVQIAFTGDLFYEKHPVPSMTILFQGHAYFRFDQSGNLEKIRIDAFYDSNLGERTIRKLGWLDSYGPDFINAVALNTIRASLQDPAEIQTWLDLSGATPQIQQLQLLRQP